jgi:hypothetical protein
LVILAALVVAGNHFRHGGSWRSWGLFLWSCLLACFLLQWPDKFNPFYVTLPSWLVQGSLSITGLMLAATPLLEIIRSSRDRSSPAPLPAFSS